MREWLDSRDFYELCQQYRWAQDALPRGPGALTAAEAFEVLKDEILKHAMPVPTEGAELSEGERLALLYRDGGYAYGR